MWLEWPLSYQQLEDASSLLASQLSQRGVKRGGFVPVLFEKSIWAAVVMLAVVKSGAAFVPLDAGHPEGRLRGVMQILKVKLIVCSSRTSDLASRLSNHIMIADASTSSQSPDKNQRSCSPDCDSLGFPSDIFGISSPSLLIQSRTSHSAQHQGIV